MSKVVRVIVFAALLVLLTACPTNNASHVAQSTHALHNMS